MVTAILPATNHKPNWVELRVDDQHVARIWAHSVEVRVDTAVTQFQVTLLDANGVTDAFVWADTIVKAKE